ncbi:MAG: cobalamin biosynthesis protein [Pseudomonadota bacterium]
MVEFIQNIHSQIFDPERLPVAIVAVLLVFLFGMFKSPPGGFTTPILWALLDKLFGKMGAKMDQSGRLSGDLIFRGFLLTIFALSIFFLFGRFADRALASMPYDLIINALVLSFTMASGSSVFALAMLYKALNKKQVVEGAYYRIARSTRTNLSKSDDYTITRVGIGMILRSFDKGVIAPVLWYLIFGFSGAFIYTALAGLSWRFGRDGHNKHFGQTAMALERLLGFVPNMMAGFFIAVAGLFTPTASMRKSFMGWMMSKGGALYEEGGFPLTSAAWGLTVSLGGPTNDIDGHAIKRNWVGPQKATAQLEPIHLHRVIYLIIIAHILFIAALAGAMIFGENTIVSGLFEQIGSFGSSIASNGLDFFQ